MAVVRNGEVGDWRLPDDEFLASFRLPSRDDGGPLAVLNPLARDKRISFDELSHTYTIDGRVLVPRSVTGLLHEFTSEFNPERALRMMKQGREWEYKKYELEAQGLSSEDDDILRRWALNGKVASARGTLLHYHCEQMANGREIEEPHSPEFQQARMIYDSLLALGLRPFRTELSMFHCGLRLAGQADLVCRDGEGDLVIVDWKRVRCIKIENNYDCMRYPLDHLDECSYWVPPVRINAFFVLNSLCRAEPRYTVYS